MRARFEQRIAAGLMKIMQACEKQCHTVGVIERRVGRRLGRNSRAAGLFSVRVPPDARGRVGVTGSRREAAVESAQRRDGCYRRRSNVAEWTAAELGTAYQAWTQAEAAFWVPQDALRRRAVWHRMAVWVQAYIRVCFLAYVLWRTVEGWFPRAGLGRSVTTLREEFTRIESTAVVLPPTDGRTVRIRCVVRPDRAQTILLQHLGLTRPQRLRLPKGVVDL